MINFENDQLFNKAFWKYRLGEEEHIDTMAFSMLTDNKIKGIITVNKRNQDSDTWLYFDITGFSEVAKHPELIAEDRKLLQFLKDICRVYNDCDSYLLERSHVLIENTLVNAEGNAELLYIPVDEIHSESDVRTFLLSVLQAVGGIYRGPRKVYNDVLTLVSGNGFALPALESLLAGLQTDGAMSLDQNLAHLHAQTDYVQPSPEAILQNNGAQEIAAGLKTAANGLGKFAENAATKITDNIQGSLAGAGQQSSVQNSMGLGIDSPFGSPNPTGADVQNSQTPQTKHSLFGSKKNSVALESPYAKPGQQKYTAPVSPREAKKLQKEQAKQEKLNQKELARQQKEFEKQKKIQEKVRLKQQKVLQKQQAQQEKLIKKGKVPAVTQVPGMDNPFAGQMGKGISVPGGQPQQQAPYSQPNVSNPVQNIMAPQSNIAADRAQQSRAAEPEGGYTVDLEEYLRQQELAYRQSHPKNPTHPAEQNVMPHQQDVGQESGGTIMMDNEAPEETVLMDNPTREQPRYALFHERTKKTYPIIGSNVHIGRGKGTVDISIENPTNYLGADHAYITTEGEQIFLTDNNSKNHTWLNEERITPELKYELHPGDRIRMADEIFTVQQLQ